MCEYKIELLLSIWKDVGEKLECMLVRNLKEAHSFIMYFIHKCSQNIYCYSTLVIL